MMNVELVHERGEKRLLRVVEPRGTSCGLRGAGEVKGSHFVNAVGDAA
jgi:hypothetical protein